MYTQPATARTRARVIYLLDASDTMNQPCGSDKTRIGVVNESLRMAFKEMMRRSMRDGIPQPRYEVAILAYSTSVKDLLGGFLALPELLNMGTPELTAGGRTDMAAGFAAVERLLLRERDAENFQRSPAPFICHLTDGVFTEADPAPVMRRIQEMSVTDGPVLIENVYVADDMLRRPVTDWNTWPGVRKAGELANEYARYLFDLSSPLPDTYRLNINDFGYDLQPGARLFFSGTNVDLVRLAFAISAVTNLK